SNPGSTLKAVVNVCYPFVVFRSSLPAHRGSGRGTTMNAYIPQRTMSPEEAAQELGIDLKNLAALLQRFGVGRYYQPVPGQQFVYSREDIERVKRQQAATPEASADQAADE